MDGDGGVSLPFLLSELVVVYDRLPLYAEVLHPKKKSLLVDMLTMDPESIFLVMDSVLVGADALHIAVIVDTRDDAIEWLNEMNNPRTILNTTKDGDWVMLMSLKSFA